MKYMKNYGKSVLWRDLSCFGTPAQGMLSDREFELTLYGAGSFTSWRDTLNERLLLLDQRRFFSLDFSEILSNFNSVVHLRLDSVSYTDQNIDGVSGDRVFAITAKYQVEITIPVLRDPSQAFLDSIINVRVYIDQNKSFVLNPI
jgi:hypothetical protein